jgi:hypothetical protein
VAARVVAEIRVLGPLEIVGDEGAVALSARKHEPAVRRLELGDGAEVVLDRLLDR